MNTLNKIEFDFISAFGLIIGKASKLEERVEKTAGKLKLLYSDLCFKSINGSPMTIEHKKRSEQRIIKSIMKLLNEYFNIEDYANIIEESFIFIERSGVYDIEEVGDKFKYFVRCGKAYMEKRYSNIKLYNFEKIINTLDNGDYSANDIKRWIEFFEQIKILLIYFHNLDTYIERYIKTD